LFFRCWDATTIPGSIPLGREWFPTPSTCGGDKRATWLAARWAPSFLIRTADQLSACLSLPSLAAFVFQRTVRWAFYRAAAVTYRLYRQRRASIVGANISPPFTYDRELLDSGSSTDATPPVVTCLGVGWRQGGERAGSVADVCGGLWLVRSISLTCLNGSYAHLYTNRCGDNVVTNSNRGMRFNVTTRSLRSWSRWRVNHKIARLFSARPHRVRVDRGAVAFIAHGSCICWFARLRTRICSSTWKASRRTLRLFIGSSILRFLR